jgi:diadenosine tetraphosphatase ApaH/serine/threonine PP2A family protein phosphatase
LSLSTFSANHQPIYITGDIHGQYPRMVALLQQADLIDAQQNWRGGSAHLWFTGDFLDRGEHGLAAIDLVMKLQKQAADEGGGVHALIGNHEVMFLAARQFGGPVDQGEKREPFVIIWMRNGGSASERASVTDAQLEWLSNLPAMARVDDYLLIHADALFYRDYGESVEAVNAAIRQVLHNRDEEAWDLLIDRFTDRIEFAVDGGARNVRAMLDRFGGKRLVHGHTPIHILDINQRLQDVQQGFWYADDLCLAVDAGLYLGGAGFIEQLVPHDPF